MDTVTLIAVAAVAFLLSGAIKGVAGIGLPSAAIAFMTLVLDPRTAIALLLFPMIGSNLWQLFRARAFRRTARRYAVFSAILFVGVGVTAFWTKDTSDRALLAIIGVAILLFVVVSWRQMVPQLAARYDTHAQVGFGLLAGFIGGMTAAWGPPMAMYLTTKGVNKDEFIRATGFMISVGSIPLVLAYIQLGFLTGPLAGISLCMLLPTLLGFTAGEYVRNRMSVEAFRNAILIVFFFLGLNLLRRSIWYG